MTKGPLSRYYAILEGEESARYLLTKTREVTTDTDTPAEVLWVEHERRMVSDVTPSNGTSVSDNLLGLKAELARRMIRECMLCERRCKVDRLRGERGCCGVLETRITTDFLHMGEEPDLVPSYTIFFAGCTFQCVYCQNWDISTRPGAGRVISPKALAEMIRAKTLKRAGSTAGLSSLRTTARNVNWVGGDPTSNLPFILETLQSCEVNIPQVWNSNMYLSEESMRLLDGVIDVYLTDFKYGNDKCALRLSNAPDYMKIVSRNHKLARNQCEIIIRHLVLPNHLECCTIPVLEWIAENLTCVKVNIMAQYRPEHRARDFDEINRPLRMSEFETAIDTAEELGLDIY